MPESSSRTPKLFKALPKNTGVMWPFEVGFAIEFGRQPARHLDLVAQALERARGQALGELGIVEPGAAQRLGDALALAAREQQQRVGEQIIGAEEIAAHADGPARRHHLEREMALDLVHQVEGIARPRGRAC